MGEYQHPALEFTTNTVKIALGCTKRRIKKSLKITSPGVSKPHHLEPVFPGSFGHL